MYQKGCGMKWSWRNIPALSWRDWENHEKPQSGQSVFGLRFEPEAPPTTTTTTKYIRRSGSTGSQIGWGCHRTKRWLYTLLWKWECWSPPTQEQVFLYIRESYQWLKGQSLLIISHSSLTHMNFSWWTDTQTDYVLIDGSQQSSVLDGWSFGGTNCDTDEYLVVVRLRERLSISKQTAQMFDTWLQEPKWCRSCRPVSGKNVKQVCSFGELGW